MSTAKVIPFRSRRRRARTLYVAKRMALLAAASLCWILADTFMSDTRRLDPPSDISVRSLNGGDAWAGIEGTSTSGTSGPRIKVRDGDTVVIGGTPVRLANLDCAEAGTPAGDRATARMKQLAKTGAMRCTLSDQISYDRRIGTCTLYDGRDVGAVLIAEGVCSRWR